MSDITAEQIYERVTEYPSAMLKDAATFTKMAPQLAFTSTQEIAAFVQTGAETLGADGDKYRAMFADVQRTGGAGIQTLLRDLFAALGGNINSAFLKQHFRNLYGSVYGGTIDKFATGVNDPAAIAASKGTVVFVARVCYHVIQREAMFLRAQGYRTGLICLTPLVASTRTLFERSFDHILDDCPTYIILEAVLARISPDVLHIQCTMWEYLMARFVLERNQVAKIVCEFYDVTGMYGSRKALHTNWWPSLVDLDLDCERRIFQRADGIVHRFDLDLFAEYGGRHGVVPPNIEMQQFPIQEFTRYAEPMSNTDGLIRCVYLGSLIPRNDAHPRSLFPLWGMPEAWCALLEQGIVVTVFNSPFRGMDEDGLDIFKAMQDRYPNFSIETGLPSDRLGDAIAGFDFGLGLAEIDVAELITTPYLMKGAVGTKLFNYFEAGLPVLVNREFEAHARIVEANGLGLALNSREISTLSQKIATSDRDEMRANVRRFNEAHGMGDEIHRLIDLYDRIGAFGRHMSGERC